MASGGRSRAAARAGKAIAALGVGAAGVLGLGIGTAASAAEPTQQELLEQIKALQSKVEQLEQRQQQQLQQQPAPAAAPDATTRAAQQPAAAREATVESVLRDAERRSSPAMLQSEGFTAGYSNGRFLIQDAGGNFVLNPNLQFQARYVANFRDLVQALPTDDTPNPDSKNDVFTDGFEIRRMKFSFDGSVFGPTLTYKFQWGTERSNGTPVLEDAWLRYALGDMFGDKAHDWAVRVGQFKDPTFHEEITSSKRQLAADRSLLNELLAGGITDWVQGVSLIWDDGAGGSPMRAEIGFSDGPGTRNTNFTDGGGGLPANLFPGEQKPTWGAFARAEWILAGDWKQYDDFTALGNTRDLFVVGAGASYAEAGRSDILFHTVDVQYETERLGLYAAYVALYNEPNGIRPGTTDTTVGGGAYDWGFLVQAGYMLDKKWEVFGRFDETFLDSSHLNPNSDDTFPEFTAGVNYYIRGHALKLTIDGTIAPNGVPSNQSGLGLLDPDADKTQIAIRGQLQLLL
jgi:hypothetical protein